MHFFDFSYRNICTIQKKVVILQAFSRKRARRLEELDGLDILDGLENLEIK